MHGEYGKACEYIQNGFSQQVESVYLKKVKKGPCGILHKEKAYKGSDRHKGGDNTQKPVVPFVRKEVKDKNQKYTKGKHQFGNYCVPVHLLTSKHVSGSVFYYLYKGIGIKTHYKGGGYYEYKGEHVVKL